MFAHAFTSEASTMAFTVSLTRPVNAFLPRLHINSFAFEESHPSIASNRSVFDSNQKRNTASTGAPSLHSHPKIHFTKTPPVCRGLMRQICTDVFTVAGNPRQSPGTEAAVRSIRTSAASTRSSSTTEERNAQNVRKRHSARSRKRGRRRSASGSRVRTISRERRTKSGESKVVEMGRGEEKLS